MRTLFSIVLYTLLFLAGGIGFAALWIRVPALGFINLPEPAWLYLMDVFDAHCCESAMDLQITVALIFGGVLTALLTLIVHLIKKRLK